jgi:hypothetical protein
MSYGGSSTIFLRVRECCLFIDLLLNNDCHAAQSHALELAIHREVTGWSVRLVLLCGEQGPAEASVI